MKTWPARLATSVFLSVLLHAVPSAQDDPPAADLTVEAGQQGIDRADAQKRIAELESSSDMDEASRTRLIETYKQIDLWLEKEAAYTARMDAFRAAVEAAPDETTRAHAELAEHKSEPRTIATPDPGSTAEEVDQRLAQVRAEVTRLRSLFADIDRNLADERVRRTSAEEEQSAARSDLENTQRDLDAAAPEPDAPEATLADRWHLIARERARSAEVAMLEQEMLSQPTRTALLESQRELLALRIADAEARAGELEEWVRRLRQTEADRANREAARLRRDAIGKHELIVKVAEEIAGTSNATQKLLVDIDGLRSALARIETLKATTEENLRETKNALDLGIEQSLGTALLEQRRKLPTARSIEQPSADRSSRAMEERYRLFIDEREIKALSDPDRVIDQMLSPLPSSSLGDDDRAALRIELEALLATKAEHLQLLQKARADYLSAIGDLEAREAALLSRARELADILDERLLWIRNARPFGTKALGRLQDDVTWLASSALWGPVVEVAMRDARDSATGYALATILILGLWASRRRMRARVDSVAERVGRVRTDSIVLTVEALGLLILHTVPLPTAIALLGWRLMHEAEPLEETAKAVGAGLVTVACIAFVFQLLRQLCRAQGIARAHFRWDERTDRLIRAQFLWCLPIALVTGFLVALTESQPDHLRRHSLGRLAFIVLMVAAAVAAYRLLHPERGLYPAGRTKRAGSALLRRTRAIWMPLGVALPIALATLAAMGYYYAALQLELRLNETLLIILAGIFVHAFLLRWLSVSQRRLAMKVFQEKRAAAEKARGDGEREADAEGVVEPPPEIDVIEIKEQTQDLLHVTIGIAVLVGFWFAWVGVMPALGVLDEFTLWNHTAIVDGVATQVPTTLANLALALFLIGITITAARNMPGFLEIALLQRLPLEPGARYATRALVLYAIVSTGFVLSFNTIGVGWTSVQWLVAALTVGLGFGLQEIFANFVSGLIILIERPVRVGDTVTVANVSGVVSRIRMRATTITDWKRRELVVPNKSFITNELINWSLSDPIMRLDFLVGIAYGSDTKLAHSVILRICRQHPTVLAQPEPDVFFTGFGDNSLNFEARVFTSESSNTARTRILHDLHMAIDQACRENAITIAFPQRDLHFKSSEAVLKVQVEPPSRD